MSLSASSELGGARDGCSSLSRGCWLVGLPICLALIDITVMSLSPTLTGIKLSKTDMGALVSSRLVWSCLFTSPVPWDWVGVVADGHGSHGNDMNAANVTNLHSSASSSTAW